jgi:hypothetical protein
MDVMGSRCATNPSYALAEQQLETHSSLPPSAHVMRNDVYHPRVRTPSWFGQAIE